MRHEVKRGLNVDDKCCREIDESFSRKFFFPFFFFFRLRVHYSTGTQEGLGGVEEGGAVMVNTDTEYMQHPDVSGTDCPRGGSELSYS